jgi:hypothetical protein
MRGKWAAGIAPRNFAWVIKDKLALSERPGGYARNHRKVRRQEEIIWLREQGFSRIVTLLPSPHNLHAYDELGMTYSHVPFAPTDDARVVLKELYARLHEWIAAGERLLIHQEELSDRLIGTVGGYLVAMKIIDSDAQAIMIMERLTARQMGPTGRELVALAADL